MYIFFTFVGKVEDADRKTGLNNLGERCSMGPRKCALVVCLFIGMGLLAVTGTVWAADKELANENIAVKFEREVERGAYKVVTTQELKSWIDQKKDMLTVDTMPPDNFKKQHIPGAVNFEVQRHPELTQMSDKMQAELEKLLGTDKDRTIVFYCGFTDCERSHNAAMWAVKIAYKNAYRQPGGITGWLEAGYPVEKLQ
jgi:thiosulfate/3-mercaptopyruvate sulfurtransferase